MSPTASKSEIEYLVPPGTVVETRGSGAPLQLGELTGKRLMISLRLTEIIEQESLEVSLWGSPDGNDWGTHSLFVFPQVFYRGTTPAALDLSQRPEVRFLEARWDVNRWGRGYPRPHFEFSVEVQQLTSP
jgi:hypothetical protein